MRDQGLHLALLLNLVVPEWKDTAVWIVENLPSVLDGVKPSTRQGSLIVELDHDTLFDWLTVSITSR